jgi:hypothetical protein
MWDKSYPEMLPDFTKVYCCLVYSLHIQALLIYKETSENFNNPFQKGAFSPSNNIIATNVCPTIYFYSHKTFLCVQG